MPPRKEFGFEYMVAAIGDEDLERGAGTGKGGNGARDRDGRMCRVSEGFAA